MTPRTINAEKLRELWVTKIPTREIAATLGHSPDAVRNKARRLGLPSRGLKPEGRKRRKSPDPIAKPKPLLSTITDLAEAIREHGDTYRGRAAIAAQFGTAETRVTLAFHTMRAK